MESQPAGAGRGVAIALAITLGAVAMIGLAVWAIARIVGGAL